MFFPEAADFLRSLVIQPSQTPSKIAGASIDTRTLQPGNLFVALPGTKEDGHRFLPAAFEKGASGALVEKKFYEKNKNSFLPAYKNLIPVENTAEAFLKLSAYYKKQFNLRATLGVVGSVGKTSTKEFLYYLLRQKASTLATQGNLNNHLGLPLTLFRLENIHQYCLCELGTNRLGDIRQLAEVLRPDHGLLTRIAAEHLEGFGTLENIYRGEMELFEELNPGSYAVIPDDDPILLQKLKRMNLKLILVGKGLQADYHLTQVRVENQKVFFKVNGEAFCFPGVAGFLSRNAAMAIAMAEICGLSLNQMPKEWDDFKLPGGRFEEQEILSGIYAIYDGYNASPASFEAALQTFEEMKIEGRKFLVFSDMLELGSEEKKFHETLGSQIASVQLDGAVGYGPRTQWTVKAIQNLRPNFDVQWRDNAQEAAAYLQPLLQKGDRVLMKGSRSMKVEEVLQHLSGVKAAAH